MHWPGVQGLVTTWSPRIACSESSYPRNMAALMGKPRTALTVMPLKNTFGGRRGYHRTLTGTLLRHPHLCPHPHHFRRHISSQAQYACARHCRLTGESGEHHIRLLKTVRALRKMRHAWFSDSSCNSSYSSICSAVVDRAPGPDQALWPVLRRTSQRGRVGGTQAVLQTADVEFRHR